MRFLLVDAIDEFRPGEELTGRLMLTRTLRYPVGRPDRSGPAPSLLLEALAQAGAWLIKASRDFRVLAVMTLVSGFRLHGPVPPSGTLRIRVRTLPSSSRLVGITGTLALASGETVASVDSILYVLIPTPEGPSYAWGKSFWEVLVGPRKLTILEEPR